MLSWKAKLGSFSCGSERPLFSSGFVEAKRGVVGGLLWVNKSFCLNGHLSFLFSSLKFRTVDHGTKADTCKIRKTAS